MVQLISGGEPPTCKRVGEVHTMIVAESQPKGETRFVAGGERNVLEVTPIVGDLAGSARAYGGRGSPSYVLAGIPRAIEALNR